MNRLANLITGRPGRVLSIGLLVIVLAAVLGGPLPGMLTAGDDFDDPGSQSAAARVAVERATGASAAPDLIALVPTPQGAATPAGSRAVADVMSRVERVPGVARVITPDSATGTVATDGSSAIVPVLFDARAVDADVVAGVETALRGTDTSLGGGAAIQEQVSAQVQSDLLRAELIALPLLLLLSLWIFRSPVAALLPVLVGCATVMGTFFTLRVLDTAVMGISVFALNLVTGLGLGLAIDYSLLMVSRFREELAAGRDTRAAVGNAVRAAGRTIVFSALTVAAALASLLVFPQVFLRSMSVAGIAVPLVAMLVSLTVLPAALALLGRRVDALTPRRWVRREPTDAQLPRTGWHRLATWVLRRPGRVAVAVTAVLIIVGLPFLGARFTQVDARVLATPPSHRRSRWVMCGASTSHPQRHDPSIRWSASSPTCGAWTPRSR